VQRRWHERAAALAILPILLVSGAVQAGLLYRCRMGGETRNACCCSALQDAPAESPRQPLISRAACCDTEAWSHVGAAPATRQSERNDGALACAAALAAPVALAAAPPSSRLVPAHAHAPPHRPPLVLQKMSLRL
jgi:hypothetical protein